MRVYHKFLSVVLLLTVSCTITLGQEIGANFNHDPEIIDLRYLAKAKVDWIRTTPYIFEYIRGEKNIDTEPGLAKIIEAKKKGYKVAFGFRWDFRKYNLAIPGAGSKEETKYFDVVTRILDRVGPYIDIFKLGNEPNLETKETDLQMNQQGFVPLVRFTERLLTEAVEPYYKKHPQLKRPDVYTGSLPRLFLQEEQTKPGVVGLIKLAQENNRIKGLSVHLHIADSMEMEAALKFVRTIMPKKPIIVPEYSLFRLYNNHVSDVLGDNPAGEAFAKKYGYTSSMKLYGWYSKANTERVSSQEWEDMFASRTWFPRHFMQTYYRYFQQYGVVLATYGFISQSAPKQMGPGSPTWFINPLYPTKSLLPHADGSYMENPLWWTDFEDIVHRGKKNQ